jgi:catechol 2,3-dioxygenase-like lactoylglutathione lyase family enzyme
MILGFAHPAIVVKDLDRATEFYCDAFGFREFSGQFESWRDTPAIDAAVGLQDSAVKGRMLAGHNCFLELFQFEKPEVSGPDPRDLLAHELGIRHLSFFVDDIEVEYHRLLALGASPLGTPQKSKGVTAVYLRDPEGNIVEIAEVPHPSEDLRLLPGVNKLQGEDDGI